MCNLGDKKNPKKTKNNNQTKTKKKTADNWKSKGHYFSKKISIDPKSNLI